MDVNIKSEPDILEDTISQSCEFLDENPIEINTFPQTNTKNYQQQQRQASRKTRPVKYQTKKKYNSANKNLKQITKDKKMDSFTLYLKRRFLEIFHQEGCSPQTVAKHANAYNVNVGEVNDFFDEAAKEAQRYVYQECDSLSFNNITEWLNYFQTTGVSEHCNYEPAIIMNAIANNEYHPQPETMEGINLKEIYSFLSNALMGLPQKPLDEASAKFLSNEFQNLINEANTDEADNDVRDMKRKIEFSLGFNINRRFYNLDPLNTDTKQLEKGYITNLNCNNLKCENMAAILKK